MQLCDMVLEEDGCGDPGGDDEGPVGEFFEEGGNWGGGGCRRGVGGSGGVFEERFGFEN